MTAWLLRKLGMNVLAALAVFALAGGALAATALTERTPEEAEFGLGVAAEQSGLDLFATDEDGDEENDVEEVDEENDVEEVEEVELEAEDNGEGPHLSAACAGVEDDVDGLPFGCYRAYQVWQACGDLEGEEREACEEDLGPAWEHPRHPVFGEDGKFAEFDWRPGDGPPPWAGDDDNGDDDNGDGNGNGNGEVGTQSGADGPATPGPPSHAGPKDGAGAPSHAGPPSNAGRSGGGGPPSNAGRGR